MSTRQRPPRKVGSANTTIPLSEPCDHVLAIPTKDGRCAILLFGGSGKHPETTESIMQVPRPPGAQKSDHARYMTATVKHSRSAGQVLSIDSSVRDFMNGGAMEPSVITHRDLRFPDSSRSKGAVDLSAVAEQKLRQAIAAYDKCVPHEDQPHESALFKQSGIRYQMVQRNSKATSRPYARMLVSKGRKGYEMKQIGSVPMGATVLAGHQDRVENLGADPNTVLMKVDEEVIRNTVNKLLDAASWWRRIEAFCKDSEDVVRHIPDDVRAICRMVGENIKDIYDLVRLAVLGSVAKFGQIKTELLETPHLPLSEAETGFTDKGPVQYISDVVPVQFGDMLFPTMHGPQVPCTMTLMRPSQVANLMQQPGLMRDGLHAHVDTSLHDVSNGAVPIRMVLHDVSRTGKVSQSCAVPRESRAFRCAHDPSQSAAMGTGPVTMAIYTPDGYVGAGAHRSAQWSATGDFVCGRLENVAYIQRDERHDSAMARCVGKPCTDTWSTQLGSTETALKQAYTDLRDMAKLQCDRSFPPYPKDDASSWGIVAVKERFSKAHSDISDIAKFGTEMAGLESGENHAQTLARLRDFGSQGKTPLQIAMARKTAQLIERSERMVRLITDEHPVEALPRVARIEPFRFNSATDCIHNVHDFKCIGAKDTYNCVNGRAVVLATYGDPTNGGLVDSTVMLVDRTAGCDPDRRSTRMDSAELIRRSSVRHAIGQEHNDKLVIDSVHEYPINGTCKIDTISGGTLDTNQWVTLKVNWREEPGAERRSNLLHVSAANRLRWENGTRKARTYTDTENGVIRSKFNPEWGLRVMR